MKCHDNLNEQKIKRDIAPICSDCKHSGMSGAQSPPEKRRRFFLGFIRRLLEHAHLLDLAYRMNKSRWRGKDNSGGWAKVGQGRTVGRVR